MTGIEVAHVRLGSGAGMGQKPDDWRTVSLCGPCHTKQHSVGESTFWSDPQFGGGSHSPEVLCDTFAKASPKAREIAQIKKERGE